MSTNSALLQQQQQRSNAVDLNNVSDSPLKVYSLFLFLFRQCHTELFNMLVDGDKGVQQWCQASAWT